MKKQCKWIWYALWLVMAAASCAGTPFCWMPRKAVMFYSAIALMTLCAAAALALLAKAKGKNWKIAGILGGIVYLAVIGGVTLLCDHVLFPGRHVYASLTITLLNFNFYLVLAILMPRQYDPKLHILKRIVAVILIIAGLVTSGLTQNFWWSSERADIAIGSWQPTDKTFDAFTTAGQQTAFDEGEFVWGEKDLMVSPDGVDSNPGTQEKPLATLSAAKEKAVEGSTVWFKAGTYLIENEIVFDETNAKNVTYRSVPGEEVIFTGAVAISDWENGQINGVNALVADVDTDTWYFRSLFMNGERLQVSCWPKEGTFQVADALDSDKLADSTDWGVHGAFYANTDEIMDFSNLEDVYIRMSHWWLDQLMPISSVDTATGRIEVSRGSSRSISIGDDFVYENVRDTLSEPGQWYLDRSEGKLYYIPRSGETAENTVVYAPVNSYFLRFDGAESITVQGIRFENTDWDFFDGEGPVYDENHPLYANMKYATGAYQANLGCPDAISVSNGKDIHFVDCEMKNISFNCIQFGENTRDCSVTACRFLNIGGTSVVIRGINEAPSNTGDISITDCEVAGYGQVFNQSVGIHLQHGDNVTISNNEIHDGNYSGISAGWIWGYDPQINDNIKIQNNLIYNIAVDGLLSDLGGIYLLGPQYGSVLSGNVIYNVDCHDYGATGIYLDAGSSGWTIENNLVCDCATQCFTTANGRDNVVRNNIFAYGNRWGFYVGTASDVTEPCEVEFYNNIVVTDDVPIMEEVIPMDGFVEKNNLFCDYSRDTIYCGLSTLFWERVGVSGMNKVGHFEEDVVADPMFADAANRDFTLNENSPAFDCGFTPWETKAGSRIDFED